MYSISDLYEKYGSDLRFHSVEVPIPSASGKYNFLDDSILRNMAIVGFTPFPPSLIYFNTDPAYTPNSPVSLNPIINPEAFYSSFLTLKCGNLEMVENLPLINCAPTQANGIMFFPIDMEQIDPTLSFIFCSNTTLIVVGETYFFTFAYVNAAVAHKYQ